MESQNKEGKIQIFAKNIIGKANGQILEESKKTKNNAGQKNIQNGKANGVNNSKHQNRGVNEITEIKSIVCLSDLDNGSANDGTGINTKKGVIFGKTYVFKVESYTNGEPKDFNNIKWIMSYIDPNTNILYQNILLKDIRGESIRISFTGNINICGCELEIRAFIFNKDRGANLKVWHHNRFRWFDGKRVYNELALRNKNPELIDQSGTSLCGMACIFYLFAKYEYKEYEIFVKQLFRTGQAGFNRYTVKPSEELLNKEIDNKGYPVGTGTMPLVDYITLAGTRNTDNPSYKGGDEEFQAINWPQLMTSLPEKLLGYNDVSSKGIYNPIKTSRAYDKRKVWELIEDINSQIMQGYKIMLMIDSDLISEDEDNLSNFFQFEYHWVVLETPITLTQNWNEKGEIFYTVDFKVFTWVQIQNF